MLHPPLIHPTDHFFGQRVSVLPSKSSRTTPSSPSLASFHHTSRPSRAELCTAPQLALQLTQSVNFAMILVSETGADAPRALDATGTSPGGPAPPDRQLGPRASGQYRDSVFIRMTSCSDPECEGAGPLSAHGIGAIADKWLMLRRAQSGSALATE